MENLIEDHTVLAALAEGQVSSGVYVSVIIPTFNDREHVVEAVRSVTRQTLQNIEVIVADDGSTDGTEALIGETFADDPRVRYMTLGRNSGAAGAPRNMGIESAVGDYVLFLDSDDILQRHACKNLFIRAQASGADVTGGLTVRYYIESGATEKWYPHLYRTADSFSSINERPLFTHDTLITNKLFRRQFLLASGVRFPEDMHYEDVVFAADVYSRAKGFELIPETVYIWNVYPIEVRQSITNQRNMKRNLSDRIRSIELAREAYAGASSEVGEQLEQKVMRHHLRLYLNDIEQALPDDAAHILRTTRLKAQETSRAVFEDLEMPLKLLYASVIADDLPAVVECVRALERSVFPGVVLRTEEAATWTPFGTGSELQLPEEWAWLADLSDAKILGVPHGQFDYLHTATEVIPVGARRVRISGEFRDSLGKVGIGRDSAALIFRTILGVELSRYDLALEARGAVIRWSVEVDAPERRGLSDHDGRTFDVELTLADGARSTRPLFLDQPDEVSLPDRSLIGRVLGDRWVATSLPHSPSEFQIKPVGFLGRAVRRSGGWLAGAKMSFQQAVDWAKVLIGPESSFGHRAVYPLMRRLPLLDNTVFFESHMGLSVSDSPFAIYSSMRATEPDLCYVWSTQPHCDTSPLSGKTRTVVRGSYRYFLALARSRFIVDNQSLPRTFVKRSGQRYLQTWHGIPFKKMGKDESRFSSVVARQQLDSISEQWDLLNIPSPYFGETFVPAFGYRGEELRYGSPRNDALVKPAVEESQVRRMLDIPAGMRVVLFAPTFRENRKDRHRPATIDFDLSAWAERFGDEAVLLVRSHYLNRFSVPRRLKGSVIDVSGYPNISDLYILADTLVTDYSSVMFDFAILRKPIVIFAPDYEHYIERSRGAYFDLQAESPGPFTTTQQELFEALEKTGKQSSVGGAHVGFLEKYCGVEDGSASERSVKALLGAAQ